MRITLLTMFPESFTSILTLPLIDRAIKRGVVELNIVDIKDYAGGSFRHIDDSPCGGGKGMILRFDTVMRALSSVKREESKVILTSPKGKLYDQKKARELASLSDIIIISGHYEGIDRRVENHVDEIISIGDYVLSGGEIASSVILDSICRLQKGIIREGATEDESHENGLLEYPQYTKPIEYMGERVPSILLSGNHGAIDKWRKREALLDTKRLRPDLFEKYKLTKEEEELITSSL